MRDLRRNGYWDGYSDTCQSEYIDMHSALQHEANLIYKANDGREPI